ncbi:hypothetical protein PSECIP111951_02487 [Pseudoalteromonas holothuriae]|uniref:NADPH-dependent FMN reductase-like domain-containing protein n=1 Tax=Pseudoalteromonas holothuriae TaxID=2963714 RepID=A0ABM9GJL5_9GAMM|nr:NAD(P)H-dependent oxidoreductase [Pseudoalteromonas sp. CIP111951]CAH9061423.1 hypothetical protein PSECIP111951_02487 [Pseudoalteromonas sp. CIP111951]
MRNTLILFSSANENGNTFKLTNQVMNNLANEQVRFFHIDKLNFADYNYNNQYSYDDFYRIVEALDWADNIIFASPVYWYSVSANMKRLIDRMTELTENPTIKPIGKALKGKRGYVLTTSASEQVCDVFARFFNQLYSYFDIKYSELLHASCREEFTLKEEEFRQFIHSINRAPAT